MKKALLYTLTLALLLSLSLAACHKADQPDAGQPDPAPAPEDTTAPEAEPPRRPGEAVRRSGAAGDQPRGADGDL